MGPRIILTLGTISLLLFAAPAIAHHSFAAEFGNSPPVTLKGTITKLDWINPHVYVYLDVKDEDGRVVNWELESWPTGLLHKSGVTRERLMPGQEVTIQTIRAKDGTKNLAWIRNIKFADGAYFELSSRTPSAGDHEGPPD
jgi:hypothetical protein